MHPPPWTLLSIILSRWIMKKHSAKRNKLGSYKSPAPVTRPPFCLSRSIPALGTSHLDDRFGTTLSSYLSPDFSSSKGIRMSITSPARTALCSTRVLSTLPRAQINNKRPVLNRKMSSDNTPNFDFPERKPSEEEKQMIDDVLNLCTWLLIISLVPQSLCRRRGSGSWSVGCGLILVQISFGPSPRRTRAMLPTRGSMTLSVSRTVWSRS